MNSKDLKISGEVSALREIHRRYETTTLQESSVWNLKAMVISGSLIQGEYWNGAGDLEQLARYKGSPSVIFGTISFHIDRSIVCFQAEKRTIQCSHRDLSRPS